MTEHPYVVLTFTNAQPTATPAPFQQMLSLNTSLFTPFQATDLGNIRFYSDAAFTKPILSWIESGNSSSGTTALIWLLLPKGIAANSSMLVYMVFLSTTTVFDGVNAGLAPQLSATYAPYDNAASIFTFYDNFAGSVLNTAWDLNGVAGGGTAVSNGLTIDATKFTGAALSLVATYNGPLIIEAYENLLVADTRDNFLGVSFSDLRSSVGSSFVPLLPSTDTGASAAIHAGGTILAISIVFTIPGFAPGGKTVSTSPTLPATTPQLLTLVATTTSASVSENYKNTQINQSNSTNPANINVTAQYVGIAAASHAGVNVFVQWFRLRQYPPNGVMPVVEMTSVVGPGARIGTRPGKFGQTSI